MENLSLWVLYYNIVYYVYLSIAVINASLLLLKYILHLYL